MDAAALPLPPEPRALKALARTLIEQSPAEGLPLIVAGGWIADPLWNAWRAALEPAGLGRELFGRIVADYGNEVRLWVVGERPWEQCAAGLAGRVLRRLPRPISPAADPDDAWRAALARVGLRSDADEAALAAALRELRLLYEVGRVDEPGDGGPGPARHAVVWAGARPRDPEAPWAAGRSVASAAEALAEALGRFLLKDPAYPPVAARFAAFPAAD